MLNEQVMIIRYANTQELYLDPLNPRLSRHDTEHHATQAELLELMQNWVLEKLALSCLASGGLWVYQPLLVVREELYGALRLVVLDGNRRLAALKLLHRAYAGQPVSAKWASIIERASLPPELLFDKIPYLLVNSRKVQAMRGFHHTTMGVTQWHSSEKASFIAALINKYGLSYEQVAHQLGSAVPIIRKHYIAHQILLQIEELAVDLDMETVEGRFTILFLTIATVGGQQYLQIDIRADTDAAKYPVPDEKLANLVNVAHWLFGSESSQPLFITSQSISDFGEILANQDAVDYLETTPNPNTRE